jgi:hypothetical protein
MGIDARMLVKVPRKVGKGEILQAELHLFELFGCDKFFVYDKRPAVRIVDEYEQDGDSIFAKEGESIVVVSLWTRYYGVGYERGDFRLIHDLAEALEILFEDGEVHYGGDSSGVCAEPFGKKERAKLRKHWLQNARRPYTGFMASGMQAIAGEKQSTPTCSRHKVAMVQYGFGRDYGAYACPCGEKFVVRGEVETRTTEEDRKLKQNATKRRAFDLLRKEEPEISHEDFWGSW